MPTTHLASVREKKKPKPKKKKKRMTKMSLRSMHFAIKSWDIFPVFFGVIPFFLFCVVPVQRKLDLFTEKKERKMNTNVHRCLGICIFCKNLCASATSRNVRVHVYRIYTFVYGVHKHTVVHSKLI